MTYLIPSVFALVVLIYMMIADVSRKVDAMDKSTQESRPYTKVYRVKMNRRPRSLRVKP